MSGLVSSPFRPSDPLPTGTTVLEASAGTGKTYAVAALAARYVAEGVPIDQLLVLTFSRTAARELRSRVRERLVAGARALRHPTRARTSPDAVLQALAGPGDAADVRLRQRRLAVAATGFDTATVSTIHQFSARTLTLLGMSGDGDEGERFDPSPGDLADDAAETVFLRDHVTAGPAFAPDAATRIARAAVSGDPAAVLLPHSPADPVAAARTRFARDVRTAVQTRRRVLGRFGYDDQLTRLRDVLADPASGDNAVSRLRERYLVTLVDEFQDTDPVQWEILRLLARGHGPLILIGDPKQAIYGFRGADVDTYLTAAAIAESRYTLDRNWRCDPGVVAAVGMLLGSASLGDERIRVYPVSAALEGSRLVDAGAPVRIRMLDRASATTTASGLLRAPAAREAITADLVHQVTGLLEGPARLTAPDPRPVAPGDVAVLVALNSEADLVHGALTDAGVPAVIAGARDVFRSPAAHHWATVLEALDQPHRPDLVRSAALTPLFGVAGEALAGDSPGLDDLAARLRPLRTLWADRGMLALFDSLLRGGLPDRIGGAVGAHRLLTDLRHVAEVVQATAASQRWSTVAQREWLREQRLRPADDEGERSRRLETDARAVQIMTIHSAKGLEFPVVMLPFVSMRYVSDVDEAFGLHDQGRRALFVGGSTAAEFADASRRHRAEEAAGSLRTLYVALTRASSQVVAWWAPTTTNPDAAFHRMLFRPNTDPDQVAVPDRMSVPTDEAAAATVRGLAERSRGGIAAELVAAPEGSSTWDPPQAPSSPLAVASFDRSLQLAWTRTSYTGLTSGPTHTALGSEPEEAGTIDEPDLAADEHGAGLEAEPQSERSRLSRPSRWADLPTGPAFGTVVHTVLEGLDTASPHLTDELRRRCDAQVAARTGLDLDPEMLTQALLASLDTPLGPMIGGRSLSQVAPRDRLDELEFELPLAGETDSGGAVLADVAELLAEHLTPDDPLRPYASRLEELTQRPLRGYLNGSIDAVLRVADPAEPTTHRYVVVDYKTNLLRDENGGVTPWAYRPEAMADAMVAAHYPLQALLYSVALHRFLRWRLPGYEPDRHLGGVQYHFLRGMAGSLSVGRDLRGRTTDQVTGVFAWPLPAALVVAVSRLLAVGATR